MRTYKTSNFKNPLSWIKRIFFVLGFAYLLTSGVVFTYDFDISHLIMIYGFLFILVVVGQFDELEINDETIIFSQKSILPFLRSERIYEIADVVSYNKADTTIIGDSILFSFLFRGTKELRLTFRQGDTEEIKGRMHKNGINGLKLEINQRRAILRE